MQVIKADNIDAAAEGILDQLSGSRVIYFDGWDGLGASAVLRAVAQRLTAASAHAFTPPLQFDQIIQIDCSKWESRRALQRVVAEQLELPPPVMGMLDRQDDEDDFNGVAQGSRVEVLQVREAMYERIQKLNHRFLVIFHNGSGEEIDLATFCGFPLSGYSRNTVLWTFQGRFRLYPRNKVDTAVVRSAGLLTDLVLSASHHEKDPEELWSYLVHQEAMDLIVSACKKNTCHGPDPSSIIDQPAQVAECFLYMWKLCGMVHHFRTDYDLATHCGSYWICDGIIQQQQQQQQGQLGSDDDGTWRTAYTLQQEMRLDVDYHRYNLRQPLPSHLESCAERMVSMPCWTSPTFLCSYTGTILFFPAGDMGQQFRKLGVLRLSHCTFSFSSPPFHHCHNLKCLWLDRCEDQVTTTHSIGKEEEEEESRRCFQRLWVLDVRYTCCDKILSAQMMDIMTQLRELNVMGAQDWDMGQLRGRMPNIRRLRVTKSTIHCSSQSKNDLFLGMNKMELLEFSGNHITSGMTSLSMAANSKSSTLESIIINDGCVGLEQISFKGCANLKNVSLTGLFEVLFSLDISGTAVKTLDLSAMEVPKLDELIAPGCNKLCAILWPPEGKRRRHLNKLRIDTTGVTVRSSASSLSVKYGSRAPTEYNWYIFVSDSRLLRSLLVFKEYFDYLYAHLEISSPSSRIAVDVAGNKEKSSRVIKSGSGNERLVPASIQNQQQQQQPEIVIDNNASVYAGVADTLKDPVQQEGEGDDGNAPTITQIWPCPRAPKLGPGNCYVYVQDQPVMSRELISTTTVTVPDMICYNANILHLHDSKSITCAPVPQAHPLEGSRWKYLYWCRVERCPSLDCVFTCPRVGSEAAGGSGDVQIFYCLKTLWSSQLPKARCIWNWSRPSSAILHLARQSFEDLAFVHVDFCPRLTHVLPLSKRLILKSWSLRSLKTLEIVWCGDLRAVFPLQTDDVEYKHHQELQQQTTVVFPGLERVHLHELPRLQGICGCTRIYAPRLENIKIKGCWSLRRLPAVSASDKNKVECECEKEWWDRLMWDSTDAKHLYSPTHPRKDKRWR
ncbi:hypothetical protein EJB05_46867, partial [Eragrostis curvula]